MSRAAQEWIPAEAMRAGPIRRAIGAAVDEWSRRWFAGTALSADRFEARDGAPEAGPAWRGPGGAVALAAGIPERTRIAGLALGAEPEGLVLSEVDRDIIGRFAATIVDDLACALETAFGVAADEEIGREDALAGDRLAFTVTDNAGGAVLRGAVARPVLALFLKAALPAPRRRGAPAARLGRAIGATRVRLEARLGGARLALGELAGLAPGDVLMLDRPVEAGADLALAGAGRGFASGAFVDGGETVSLLLSTPDRDI
jgi:hypothetical protein